MSLALYALQRDLSPFLKSIIPYQRHRGHFEAIDDGKREFYTDP
jgi:hypothetical protein